MVNKCQIHREIRKFMMISSNLIKSDDELIIEIGENRRFLKIRIAILRKINQN